MLIDTGLVQLHAMQFQALNVFYRIQQGRCVALCSAYAGACISFYFGHRHRFIIPCDVGMRPCLAAALMLLTKAQPDVELYSTSPSAVSAEYEDWK